MKAEYLERMKEMLKDRYDDYLEALQQPPQRGFRVNLLKTDEESFFRNFDIDHEKSIYACNGYSTDAPAGIGRSPEYLSGLFYMQEPSASSAVTILDPKPGMWILDLCAAPGSKSTQILEKMDHQGLFVCNEYVRKRSEILLENIERNGAANAMILNADTKDVADAFEGCFDAVLCDAPCSGEGMFRKSDDAIDMWSINNVLQCAERQREILENAYRCLKPGGVLVYSTCTFSYEENEENIVSFLKKHEDMSVEKPDVSFGHPGFDKGMGTENAVRIFPMDGGEGHFICRMRKAGTANEVKLKESKKSDIPSFVKHELEQLLVHQYPYMFLYNNRVYGGTNPFYQCGKCHLVRNQVLLGEIINHRFEPHHHLAMSAYTAFKNAVELDEEQLKKYMHGEQLSISTKKGYCVLMYHGNPVGLGKSDGTVIKNKYPKGLRTR